MFPGFRTHVLSSPNSQRSEYILLLRQCESLEDARQIHSRIVSSTCINREDTFIANLIVQMYGRCADLRSASAVFHSMKRKNIFSWSIMLKAFVDNGCVSEAGEIFGRMPQKDIVAWTAMVTAYAQNGQFSKAIHVFCLMDLAGMKPNAVSFISVLDACSGCQALDRGRCIHGDIPSSSELGVEESKVKTALLNMYGSCGCLRDAERAFESMAVRDVVAWNSLIMAYTQNGHFRTALVVFATMDLEGVEASESSFVNVLEACSGLGDLPEGRAVHESSVRSSFGASLKLQNALIHMYGKCGRLDEAWLVFHKIQTPDTVSWNSLITAHEQNGEDKLAVEIFRWMQLEGVARADQLTMMSVLSACSHAGRFEDGWSFFLGLSSDYGISPTSDHYACIVDMLGRSGELVHAQELLKNMPYQPDALDWISLLGASKVNDNVPHALEAAHNVLGLSSKTTAPYVVLSSLLKNKNV